VYNDKDFEKGLHHAREKIAVIKEALSRLPELNKLWGFKIFPKYEVRLTLYGPGGNYDSDTGTVIMLTRHDGSFKKKRPHDTIIHEFVHIGIQENIVIHYKLAHWETERLVDLICFIYFKDILPEYGLQKKGDARIDEFVNAETIKSLPSAIESYIKKYSRSG